MKVLINYGKIWNPCIFWRNVYLNSAEVSVWDESKVEKAKTSRFRKRKLKSCSTWKVQERAAVTKEERQKLVPTSTIVQKLNLSTGVEKTNQPVEKTFQTETKRKLHILYQHGLGKITVVIRSWFLELNLTWSPCNSIVKCLIEHEE